MSAITEGLNKIQYKGSCNIFFLFFSVLINQNWFEYEHNFKEALPCFFFPTHTLLTIFIHIHKETCNYEGTLDIYISLKTHSYRLNSSAHQYLLCVAIIPKIIKLVVRSKSNKTATTSGLSATTTTTIATTTKKMNKKCLIYIYSI